MTGIIIILITPALLLAAAGCAIDPITLKRHMVKG
jgi:hypothetical protein